MLYEKKFKEMVAYICADQERTKVVKELERTAQPLTTRYFMDTLWYDKEEDVLAVLKGLEKQGIIECLSKSNGKCESWDLTPAGRDVLIAIEEPASTESWFLTEILRKICNKINERIGKKS